MPLVPRLILHQEAAILLCGERPDGDDEAAPLTGKTHIEMGTDDDDHEHVSDEEHDSSNDSSNEMPSLLSLDIDCEASADQDEEQASLFLESPTSDDSLFYANDEVHVFGKTVIAVENTVVGVQEVAKKTIQGIQKAPKETVKHTTRVAKTTVKHTSRVAKKTGKVAKETAKKTAKETEKGVKVTANFTASLPHELRAHWGNLVSLLAVHALLPVAISILPTWLTTRIPVDAGVALHRRFLYGTHTLVDLAILAPFIATTHYAMPDAKIPVMTRAMAVLVGLAAVKLVFACTFEAWWHEPIFPIPFSFIISMVTSLLFSLPTLWHLTPTRNDPVIGNKVRSNFKFCFGLLALYASSLIAACLWAVVFRILSDNPWLQSGWVLFYQLVEVVFKIVIGANLSTRLAPQRWLQLNLVVDLIFANVQMSMLPYFASWLSVGFSIAGTVVTIMWRSYGGVDRLQAFLPNAKQVVKEANGPRDAFKGIGGLAAQMTVSPVNEIKPMSARLNGRGAQRNLAVWDLDDEDEEQDLESKGLERSETAETESFSESGSDDSERMDDDEEACLQSKEPTIDRRAAFANQKFQPIRNSKLEEVDRTQRHLYHVCDSISSSILVTLVRLASIMTSVGIRYLPGAENHINGSFQASDEQWRAAIYYAFAFIGGVMLVLYGIGFYIRRVANLGELKLRRIIAYIFQDSFWFFFSWFYFTQYISVAFQLDYFGADLTLEFLWLRSATE